jgi:hypothetical protein
MPKIQTLITQKQIKAPGAKQVGLCCPNPFCDYIIKDYVELEDRGEDIKEV